MISDKKINLLEEIISYNFKDKQLLKSALVHPSYVSENKKKLSRETSDFERLEFLGDRVLGLACLLYTSPSPRDAHESRMPSSA